MTRYSSEVTSLSMVSCNLCAHGRTLSSHYIYAGPACLTLKKGLSMPLFDHWRFRYPRGRLRWREAQVTGG